MPYHKKRGYNITNIDYASPIPIPIINRVKQLKSSQILLCTFRNFKTLHLSWYFCMFFTLTNSMYLVNLGVLLQCTLVYLSYFYIFFHGSDHTVYIYFNLPNRYSIVIKIFLV